MHRNGSSRRFAGEASPSAPRSPIHMPVEPTPRFKAQRGSTLRCKGWRQETILRMLENNLENAEDASRLIVYGGIGKAARNWESFDAIVSSLKTLNDNETL